jgi:tRNA A-37 threonylcarbamoyl transferase component Bud32
MEKGKNLNNKTEKDCKYSYLTFRKIFRKTSILGKLKFVIDILSGLSQLHKIGISHNDVTFRNIIYCK